MPTMRPSPASSLAPPRARAVHVEGGVLAISLPRLLRAHDSLFVGSSVIASSREEEPVRAPEAVPFPELPETDPRLERSLSALLDAYERETARQARALRDA